MDEAMGRAAVIVCQECHSSFEGAGGYHPYLYCELIKLGHADPEAYLRSYGFVKRPLTANRPLLAGASHG